MGANSLSPTRWDCSYQIIFIPKYRRRVFFKAVRKEIGNILRTLCEYKDVWSWRKEKKVVRTTCIGTREYRTQQLSVSEFMGYLKGKSADGLGSLSATEAGTLGY